MYQFVSIGDLIDLLGEPRHRVEYAIERFAIKPIGRVGIARIWSVDDVPRIREALESTAANHIRMGRRFGREAVVA